ncbi:L-threonine synthase [Granulicella pectinivorans]|uniref:L-threonine synthase n=1 Tax=Granulicella pectinivorans TaxID=474950 RepID=A0A1I6MDZ9_9BACT|nr:threonine synthase [Granulicella pectinivorans]SFS13881.1 L-threonine synthase [Granulicella pectinivorans]
MPQIAYLECVRCHAQISAEKPQTVHAGCPVQPPGSLYVRYDLTTLEGTNPDEVIASTAGAPWRGMWRYSAVLPDVKPVTLGEGWTPMLHSKRLTNAYLKEEGTNPTGTFKARGLSLAVSMAKQYGLRKLAVPSAGNAAGALAAYAAAADIEAHIFMPRDVPFANYVEAIAYGAKVTLVDGLISDCARIVAERREEEGWFDISTLKEPFRVEGKKTMGYELVEQLGWEYPEAVFYPTGGGVGLIGMWKAFEEMEQLGWVKPGKRPRMIAVQAAGCAPVTRAYEQNDNASQMWQNAATFASGLRVPKPYGDHIILDILRASDGIALSVSDEDILNSILDWAKYEGIFLSPEGASVTAAYDQLIANGVLSPEDKVVLFNTGSGLKYTDVTSNAMGLVRP